MHLVALLIPLFALLAATLPRIAQAQNCPTATASQEMVCNLDENPKSSAATLGRIGGTSPFPLYQAANAFTTGSSAAEYTLRSVRFRIIGRLGAPGDISVAIHNDASGLPGGERGTLSGTNQPDVGYHTFTAEDITLATKTTYWLVLGAPQAPQISTINLYSAELTASANEDASSTWSIADQHYRKIGSAPFAIAADTGAMSFGIIADVVASPGITASETALVIDEAGAGDEDEYTLALNTTPTASVMITPTSSDSAIATVEPQTLIFTRENWNIAQTTTVTATNDDIVNPGGQRTATITHDVTGASEYDALSDGELPSVVVTVADDDAPAFIPALRLKLRVFLESALP